MTRRHHHLRTAAAVAAPALLLLAACGSDEPEETSTTTSTSPVITAPSPTVDPTEEAEEAAIEAVERYYEVLEEASVSGDWVEDRLAEGAHGPALEDLLALGEGYAAALPAPWVFEGEITLANPVIDSLTLEPAEATVSVCKDDTQWSVVGDPPDYVNEGPDLVTYRVQPGDDGRWFVTDYAGGEAPVPCTP